MEELDSILLEWSDEIWLTLIEEAVAHENGTITLNSKTDTHYTHRKIHKTSAFLNPNLYSFLNLRL